MKHMLEHCQVVFKDHNIVSHFFNARGHDFERTLEGMLRSLACQFIENDKRACKIFLESFRKKNAKHGIGNWRWRETELRDFIVSVVQSKQKNVPQQPLILLVDALDECCESQVREVVAFLERLSAAAMSANTTLKICLSSRHYPHITMRRFQELVVERNEEHSEDIRKYVGDNLILRHQDIEASLLDKASGIFLWVVLVVALLNEAYDQGRLEAMREKVDGIPEDVEKLFENLLKTNNSKMAETVLMLQWVLFARRALKPQELYIATLVGTSPEYLGSLDMEKVTFADIQRRILSTSKGLIETRSAVGTVQFIHESVRDFLLRNRRLQTLSTELQSDPIGASHDRLKACCLSYLSLVTDEAPVPAPWLAQPTAVNTRYPFLRYASQCLLRHAEIVASRNVDQLPFLVRLLESDTIIKRVRHHHMMNMSSQNPPYATPAGLLHLLAGSGYLNLTETFIAGMCEVDIDTGAGDVGTALQFAVANGWQDVAQTLLRNGADVNAPGGTVGTALQAAIAGEKPALVSWLLGRKDIDINAWSDACGTALQLDISRGGDNTRLLLERGADVNAPAGVHGTALQAAVWIEFRALAGATLVPKTNGVGFGIAHTTQVAAELVIVR
ncbi:hypothetical protein NEMBOFW57_001099 [Staphylotrichum longicolle]|uniref:Nephrocystin 3-like N-terminal domain-containing protein n=1 Tax=Staphylotrichum longicolle TaxID=669026 RepID=A0AAD4F0X7_9PEZI|nr:hypothetical protein NEMBOFW57_001099 [Staphylotrichum longicolle]